jgi:protein-disulfide isomerase
MEDDHLTKREKRAIAKEEKRRQTEKEESTNKGKKLIVWLLVFGVISWFGYQAYKFFTTPVPEVAVTPIEIAETDWVKGDSQAKTVLLEYGDYQCPACATYLPLVNRLLEETPQGLKVVYRNFPLLQVHKNAMSSSRAAEAAGKQNKFWEMHGKLYVTQDEWKDVGDPKSKFSEYAKELGLDEQKFLNDFDSQEVANKITADIASGNVLRINSTPTFFLNGKKISPRSYEQFKSLIDTEIQGYTVE